MRELFTVLDTFAIRSGTVLVPGLQRTDLDVRSVRLVRPDGSAVELAISVEHAAGFRSVDAAVEYAAGPRAIYVAVAPSEVPVGTTVYTIE